MPARRNRKTLRVQNRSRAASCTRPYVSTPSRCRYMGPDPKRRKTPQQTFLFASSRQSFLTSVISQNETATVGAQICEDCLDNQATHVVYLCIVSAAHGEAGGCLCARSGFQARRRW